jgi:DNA-nicking Smr family endonuclease
VVNDTPAFDRRTARRIARGAIEIEARIDLHGLREHDAHTRLVAFLRRAQAAGKRTVLVITGKGRGTDDPLAPFDLEATGGRRGVLKRNVPRWLTAADVAPIVVTYTTAHARHGGDGALYVHLRKVRG